MIDRDRDRSWVARALCANCEPDALFVQGASQRQVRIRCMECEVRLECLADALESGANFGVWGGLTERERRAMRRHFSTVEDWWEWLTQSEHPLAQELRAPEVPHVLTLVRR